MTVSFSILLAFCLFNIINEATPKPAPMDNPALPWESGSSMNALMTHTLGQQTDFRDGHTSSSRRPSRHHHYSSEDKAPISSDHTRDLLSLLESGNPDTSASHGYAVHSPAVYLDNEAQSRRTTSRGEHRSMDRQANYSRLHSSLRDPYHYHQQLQNELYTNQYHAYINALTNVSHRHAPFDAHNPVIATETPQTEEMMDEQPTPELPVPLNIANEEIGIVRAPPPLLHPEEYTLQIDARFRYNNEDDKVYENLSPDQTMLITELVRSIRPYSAEVIRRALAGKMEVPMARALLSGDIHRIEAAIDTFYPIDVQKRRRNHLPWMYRLTNTERKRVIERMAEATQEPTDLLREAFLREQISPASARRMLTASREERVAFARRNELIREDIWAGHRPWKKGMSGIQRKALLQRILQTRISIGHARNLLQDARYDPGFGLACLRADEQTFTRMMMELRNVKIPMW
jgi:hypothetical protein